MYNVFSELILIKEAKFLHFSIKNPDLQKFINLDSHYFYYYHYCNCCHCMLLV